MRRKKTELKIAYEQMMRKKKIEAHLSHLETRIKRTEKDVLRLLRIVEKEEADVKVLEKLNLQSLFHKVLGNKKQELEKQRQEYLMAFLKFQGVEKNLKAMEYERTILKKQLSSLFNADVVFEKLFADVEKGFELILDDKTKSKLKQIDYRIMNHEERIKEIREAVQAGKKSEKLLLRIIQDLAEIKNWGNPFIGKPSLKIYGKGHYSSLGKKKFVNKAKSDVQKANILLEHFEIEILDIYKQFHLDYRVYIKSFSNFLEIFYDNLITDWIVKKSINHTVHAIETIHDKVARILAMLENEIAKTKEYISEEKSYRKEIIANF